jgi:hypothetical protein
MKPDFELLIRVANLASFHRYIQDQSFIRMKHYFIALLFLMNLAAFAQTGRIQGKIIDARTGETLPGATAVIEGTTKGASADFDGNFSLNNVPAGKVNLVFSYISYDSKKVTDIEIKANEVTNVNIQLDPSSSTTFTEIVIVAEMVNKENNAALTQMQKNNISVSDGISAETIKRTPDKNTSDVLKRVSGASIQDNKFVIIRGLNDRYNAAYLNGAPLPSTESDRKAFSFDIFPSNMLDNLVILKTARPDLPGEFAGGIIDITTKNIPEKNFISASVSGGYNTITTGKEQLYYNGGKKDWLGMDDGTRAMPDEIPGYLDFPTNPHDRAAIAKNTPVSDWSIHSKKFTPNQSYQVAAGYTIKLKDKDFFGVLASLSYNKTNTFFSTSRETYADQNVEKSTPENHYFDKTYSTQTLIGGLLNLSCKINENHSISSKNLYSINSDDRLIYRTGPLQVVTANPYIMKSYALWFTQNSIASSQLVGDHYIPKAKIRINWLGSFSDVKRDVPNLRRHLYLKLDHIDDPTSPNPTDTVYQAQMSNTSTGPAYTGSMLWSKLREDIRSFKADVSRPFKISEALKVEIKTGGLVQQRRRTFDIRQFGYTKYKAGSVKFQDSLLYLSEDQIFVQENMGLLSPDGLGNTGGFNIKDATQPRDPYSASSTLQAGYLMFDMKLQTWLRAVFGARVENYRQVLTMNNADYYISQKQTVKDTTVLDILPSANLIFSLTEKQNIRASYSRTLNRPEFRELAPFAFWDFNTEYLFSGNDTLQRAVIDNYDLRYEIYPGRGQIASASVFYKNFNNPIEQKAGNLKEVTYINTKRAQNYGFELEYRIILGQFMKNDTSLLGRILDNITLFTNYAYIKSVVDVSSDSVHATRPMQGQSPYLFNAGITYADTKYDFSVSALVNRFGPRLYIIGDGVVTPDLWENGRTVLDLQATKSFLKNTLEIRFNIKDALAKKQLQDYYQQKDEDLHYKKGVDDPVWSFRYGTVYSLSLSYRF